MADWRKREDALLWGAPLVLLPALALVPTVLFFIVEPVFSHARWLGIPLLAAFGLAMAVGIGKLAYCLRHPFDVISFLAAGTLMILIVVSMVCGVMLAAIAFRG